MKASDLRGKSVQELTDELQESLNEQFKLRIRKGMDDGAKSSDFKRVRRDIARIKTILVEKKNVGEAA